MIALNRWRRTQRNRTMATQGKTDAWLWNTPGRWLLTAHTVVFPTPFPMDQNRCLLFTKETQHPHFVPTNDSIKIVWESVQVEKTGLQHNRLGSSEIGTGL